MGLLKTNKDEVVTAQLIFEGPIVVEDFRPCVEPAPPNLSDKPLGVVCVRDMNGEVLGYLPVYVPWDIED